MGPAAEQKAISEIASSLASDFTERWQYAVYFIMAVGSYSISQLRADGEGGEIINVSTPTAITVNAKTLRSGMYKIDQRTWFTWELTIWEEGRFGSSFDYDNHPPFLIEPGLREYRREASLFPRSPEFTPAWLREKFDEIDQRPQDLSEPGD